MCISSSISIIPRTSHDGEGVHPSSYKMSTFMEAPNPTTISEFLPNVSVTLSTPTDFQKKNERWIWHPQKPQTISGDASLTGIGVILSHRFANGTEKPIAFMCSTCQQPSVNMPKYTTRKLWLIFLQYGFTTISRANVSQ